MFPDSVENPENGIPEPVFSDTPELVLNDTARLGISRLKPRTFKNDMQVKTLVQFWTEARTLFR
jgi:hypothetical protein